MSDAGGLQLLPLQKKKFRVGSITGKSALLNTAFGMLLILAIIYGVLWYMQRRTVSSIEVIDRELSVIHQARNEEQEEKIRNFERQVASTRSLLNSHIVWVDGLRQVQNLLDPRVVFTNLSVDATKRTYSFQASADSYSTVARQIASFYQNSEISEVILNKVESSGDDRVQFVMELKFKPDHFLLRKLSHE